MIDIRKLKELVRLMVENDLSELDLQDQQETVTIKRGSDNVPVAQHVVAQPAVAAPAPAGASDNGTPEEAQAGAGGGQAQDDLIAIESPMVGTYYSAADPDSPPFLEPGASVDVGMTVCLIEAMKVFNEIKSEVGGNVERILVENGQAVEFGQKLFLVRPS